MTRPGSEQTWCVGDVVRYTREGLRACDPPDPKVEGVIVDPEPAHSPTVRWPMGLAIEGPDHIRVVKKAQG